MDKGLVERLNGLTERVKVVDERTLLPKWSNARASTNDAEKTLKAIRMAISSADRTSAVSDFAVLCGQVAIVARDLGLQGAALKIRDVSRALAASEEVDMPESALLE